MNKTLLKKYDNSLHKLEIVKKSFILNNPTLLYKEKMTKLDSLIEKLELINPLGVLKRGYSLTYKDDKVLKEIKSVNVGDTLLIKLYDGEINTTVKSVKENKND